MGSGATTESERMDERFIRAFDKTIQFEGGYVCDPDDPGGETKFGISKRSFPDLDIRNLSVEEARRIYYDVYWLAPKWSGIDHAPLAGKLFDLGVNMGIRRAALILQIALNRFGAAVAEDGVIGPNTLKAANNFRHPEALLLVVRSVACEFYLGMNQPKYIAGWLTRLAQ